MARRPILFDATRLLTRIAHKAPTGIDRVDIAYAEHVRPGAGQNLALAGTPFGVRIMPAGEAATTVGMLAERWRGGGASAADGAALARVHAWLEAEPAEPPPLAPTETETSRSLPPAAGRMLRSLRGAAWRRATEAPRNAIYLHTSHIRLDRPDYLSWLGGRPDIRAVFFVHDLIPIDFPEYGVPGEAERHRRRMSAIAGRAAAVIVNSEDVADRFRRHCAEEGLPIVPVRAAPLGVEAAFAPGMRPRAGRRRPYFVVCGTIEARKNHLLLLQIWRDLAASLGPETPALVLVGRRGWEAEAARDLLDRCAAIRPHVIEAPGLPTSGLAELMAGARALLMPSFAEGYGIPVVEALSLGTPVIASDIPAHREIASGAATLLDPLDGTGWRDLILATAAARLEEPRRTSFAAPSWDHHFAIADDVLDRL
ncbi:glycosyltransferase family 4 protein [uncultured Enterovirga sp.]|uniref:glycosyltransferase family 4 protein n=1 Tax=uncultured Enterovirga sp. TaxID=2026352 RepID=UPI0035C97EBA